MSHSRSYWLGYGLATLGWGWALGWLLICAAMLLGLLPR